MKYPHGRTNTRHTMNRWTSVFASLAVVAGVALLSAGGASAATVQPNVTPPALPCNISVTGGGQLVTGTNLVAGVVGGTTQIKFDCNASSGADIVAEASLLAAISSSSVVQTTEADTSSLGSFTASATDTGCPAGTAGSCTVATFAVPATFTAGDANSKCPPTQAQINAGLFGCAVAVANSSEAEITGGEYLLQYASESTTPPAAPTIAATPTSGSAGSLINVADAAGASGSWWGDAVQAVQAADAGTAAAVPPAACGTAGGYGNVPSSLLEEAWYAPGLSTPTYIGPATGVTISNDCYTGTTLDTPVLGGTITVPSTVATGTAYSVYLCEVNATPFPSNDSKSAQVCGSSASFANAIDASFTFTAVAKTLSQNLPTAATVTTASSSGFTAQLASSGNNGTVTYTQKAGTPQLVVSQSGAVTTSGTLAAGTYTATGTTADPNGDSGTFSYALTVTGGTVVTTPPAAPKATRCVGFGIVGRTTTVVITGKNFTAGSKITGRAGTVATPTRTTSTRITVKVRVVKTAKTGSYRFTIKFRSGKSTSVVYTIRK